MYYIIIPKKIVDERGVFADRPRTKDGGAVITPSDLRFTRFSYGEVQLLNDSDTALLLAQKNDDGDTAETPAEDTSSSTTND